ncbi:MAG: tRNA pseudouridine(55) synthase TruB [Deltaproteobacteria bacterium]|nr:tRNA pseudouridine(55) synthase TruB [Deltaproteobacteria bacterium]
MSSRHDARPSDRDDPAARSDVVGARRVKRPVAPGFLVVDKPIGVTSHDVVAMVRALLGARRVGHTGTLDPFATGVLALAVGPATRLISFLDESRKVYEAVLCLGTATDTADTEGAITERAAVPRCTEQEVQQILASFVGPRMQTPPQYSAIKVNGRPLYSYARAGEKVDVPERPIIIHSLELLGLDGDHVRFRVSCGRGTYVRTLGEEIAQALGTVGHLVALRRHRSGPFLLDHAVSVDELARIAVGGADPIESWRSVLRPERGAPRAVWQARDQCRLGVWPHILAPEFGFDVLPVQVVSDAQAARVLGSGVCPPPPEHLESGARYVVRDAVGMLALVECQTDKARPLRVLARPPAPRP